jgi:hypothetical protein
MKLHVIVFAGIALLGSSKLCAQERFFLGATAGASSTHLSGDIPENGSYTSKTGFSAGAIAEFALWEDIHLSVQPSYVRRGTGVAYDVGEADPRDSLELSQDYISVPLIARFLTPGGSWFVNGGLDLGFLLDASLKTVSTGSKTEVRSYINEVDLMMVLGVGKNLQLDPVTLSFELRYGQSLLNAGANDKLAAKAGISPRFRSSGFQLLVALLYPL